MRKVVVSDITSLDGFIAGPGGNAMVLPMDAAFKAYNAERLHGASTLLLGRNSYLGFAAFWPEVQHDPSADADNREISRLNTAMDKVVVSDTLAAEGLPDNAWRSTSRAIRRADAAAEVERLKAEGEGDILVFGSRSTWNGLLEAGLVDELHLMVGSAPIGDGVPAIASPAPAVSRPDIGAAPFMRLLGVRTFDGSDNVVLAYAPRT